MTQTLADTLEALAAKAEQIDEDIRYYSGGSKHNEARVELGALIEANLSAIISALRERDEAVEVAAALNHALGLHTAYGCPVCPSDCSSANPPVMSCPTQAAVRAFRKFEALAKQEPRP